MAEGYLVYDVEIEAAIPEKGVARREGIRYCSGWGDHRGMGLAVVGVYDSVHDRYRVFGGETEDVISLSMLIAQRRAIVSWNGRAFDDKVMLAAGVCLDRVQQVDLLHKIRQRTGTLAGWGLAETGRRNLGLPSVTDTGRDAPYLWQAGKVGRVVDHVLEDVQITKLLLDRLRTTGRLDGPTGSVYVCLPGVLLARGD